MSTLYAPSGALLAESPEVANLVAAPPVPGLLPPFVRYFSVSIPSGAQAVEWAAGLQVPMPEELHAAVPQRQVQFAAGRHCARAALCGLHPSAVGPVSRTAAGAPLWPFGVTGSITHTDTFAAAAVAWITDASAIGIDTADVLTQMHARRIASVVAWPCEVTTGRRAGLSRLEALTLVFSIKESVFKCLFPAVGRVFGFHDVRVVDIDEVQRVFEVRLATTLAPCYPIDMRLTGRFELDARTVHTALVLPPVVRQ